MDNPASSSEPMANRISPPPDPAAPLPQQPVITDAKHAADYANFCRLSGAPEELVIDFGLNPQPYGPAKQPVVITRRIVTCWHTAKRLMHVLQASIQNHEAAFGIIETDVQKRAGRQ